MQVVHFPHRQSPAHTATATFTVKKRLTSSSAGGPFPTLSISSTHNYSNIHHQNDSPLLLQVVYIFPHGLSPAHAAKETFTVKKRLTSSSADGLYISTWSISSTHSNIHHQHDSPLLVQVVYFPHGLFFCRWSISHTVYLQHTELQ